MAAKRSPARQRPSGGPASILDGQHIVFLPGIDGTGISFEPLRALLPRNAQVTVVRYPVDRRLDFEETVAWAREQIPGGRADWIVLAESFSGPVAVRLLGCGHIKAKCLILSSTFARPPRPLLLKLARCLPLAPLLRLPLPRFLLRHVIEGGEETIDLFLGLWQRVKKRVPMKVLAHRIEIVGWVDVRPWLPRIAVPCLYIQATADRSVPAASLFDFIELVPDLRVKRIRGPHFILQARPEASLAAIRHFVSRLTNGPDA